MLNKLHYYLLLAASGLIIACSTSNKATTETKTEDLGDPVSYATDLSGIIQTSCSPCHAYGGKVVNLESLDAVKSHSKSILRRVKKDPSEAGYMPYKSKKPAWSTEQIKMFERWIAQGMPE